MAVFRGLVGVFLLPVGVFLLKIGGCAIIFGTMTTRTTLYLSLLFLLLATPSLAEPDTPAPEANESSSSVNASQGGFSLGLRIYVDPETGELTATPSPAQAEALSKRLSERLSRSTEGVVPFKLGRGGRGVYLGDRFDHALVVHRHEDGSLSYGCRDHHGNVEAESVHPQPKKPAKKAEEM